MIIESSAPTRVDLAGGTIDIWPLYLFHPGAATVNFAINLRAHCRIETRDDDRIILESRDRKVAFETELAAIEDLIREERLELISKLVHFFKPTVGFHLTAESEAPAGAGLAGSSALNIACIGALNRLVGDRYRRAQVHHHRRQRRDDRDQSSGGFSGLLLGALRRDKLHTLSP